MKNVSSTGGYTTTGYSPYVTTAGLKMYSEPEYTTADLDALTEIEMEEGYRLIWERISRELVRRCRELELPANEVHTAECRGKIVALRMVLAIPAILRQEIAAAIKEQR